MKISAIIQARMNSTRLPGKVLLEVLERPLLGYLVERLQQTTCLDQIVLATTVNPEDDQIALWAESQEVQLFRGDEDDVLDRYYSAAKLFGAQHIMRVTADCPLFNPDVANLVAREYENLSVDYAGTGPSFAEGLDCEIFSFQALEKSWQEAKLISEREHVTLFIRNHPELFKKAMLDNDRDDSKYRITVDNQEDFWVVKAVIENLYGKPDKIFTIQAIKHFLDQHPEIFRLNSHIVRNEGYLKSLQADALHTL
jgi:spore coat polysaccharide biosynthesis protein SpsF